MLGIPDRYAAVPESLHFNTSDVYVSPETHMTRQ